jgi:hypothetical protein
MGKAFRINSRNKVKLPADTALDKNITRRMDHKLIGIPAIGGNINNGG